MLRMGPLPVPGRIYTAPPSNALRTRPPSAAFVACTEESMPEQLSKEEVEALREMAANRGCRLVRSRRRKPGGDFGRMGLADLKSGREVFGFGKKGLEATPEE